MADIISAPFTDDQVKSLNLYQECPFFHPYTCGNNSLHGELIATKNGWICPMCDYVQGWAHIGSLDSELINKIKGIYVNDKIY